VATVLGIGDLADRQLPLAQVVATVQRAFDAGLNLIDTAPGYENGYSEQIVGQAAKGYRDRVFVIDKIDALDQPVAPQIEASLARLQMDYTDLFVFHNLSTLATWTKITAPGGGMEQLETAIRVGKTRFKGISSHSPDVLAVAIPSGLVDVVCFLWGRMSIGAMSKTPCPSPVSMASALCVSRPLGLANCWVIRLAITNRCRSGPTACPVPASRPLGYRACRTYQWRNACIIRSPVIPMWRCSD
jgi:hypothetical protein